MYRLRQKEKRHLPWNSVAGQLVHVGERDIVSSCVRLPDQRGIKRGLHARFVKTRERFPGVWSLELRRG